MHVTSGSGCRGQGVDAPLSLNFTGISESYETH